MNLLLAREIFITGALVIALSLMAGLPNTDYSRMRRSVGIKSVALECSRPDDIGRTRG